MTPDDISFYLVKLEAIRIGNNPTAAPLFTVVARPTLERRELGSEKKEYAKRHSIREKFWSQLLEELNAHSKLFSNISPSTDAWIGIGMGKRGINLNLVVSKKYARVEIYINRGTTEENKRIFDELFTSKDKIESVFGPSLTWERMDDGVTSRIKHQLDGVDLYNESDWPRMTTFLVGAAAGMYRAFKEPIKNLK